MEKKTIVITGSSRGIGKGLALEFLRRGHQVIVNGRNEVTLSNTLEELKHEGLEVAGITGDIQEEDTFQKLINLAVNRFGKIDIWINNAGIPQSQKFFYELSRDEIEQLVAVNISALMLGSRKALLFFMEQGYGKIFNMEGFGSNGRMMDKLTLYGSSKRAVQYFSKSLSREVKADQIQVGILSPGMVRTDFLNQAVSDANEAERERNRKVFDILAEDIDVVAEFLVRKILVSRRKYDRIEFLTLRRLLPRLLKLIFLKS